MTKLKIGKRSGLRSLALAVSYFQRLGYNVVYNPKLAANGPDLTIIRSNQIYRVEVKTVVRGTRCWLVKPVTGHRRSDDFIAMVLEPSFVHVEAMEDHVARCSKDGSRRITKLIEMVKAEGLERIKAK